MNKLAQLIILSLLNFNNLFGQNNQNPDLIFDQYLQRTEHTTIGNYQYIIGHKLLQNLHNFNDYNVVELYILNEGKFVGFVGDTTKFNYRKLPFYKSKQVRKLAKKHGYPFAAAIAQKDIIPGMDSLQMALSWGKPDTIKEMKKGNVWVFKEKGNVLISKDKKASKVFDTRKKPE